MNKKIILIFSVFIICFIGISAVSAEDNATDNITESHDSNDIDIISMKDEDNINSSYDDVLSDSGTYSNLNNKITGASTGETVYLYNNYTLTSGYSTSGISISKKITLDGKGYTIDARNNCRIFSVSGANVVLKNIVFKNAYYSGNGGAVYWSGSSGSIINCTFENDYSNYGGAVYWSSSSGKITDSTFIGNYANYNGGAVYWSSSGGSLINCTFENDYSNYGGAVYWSGSSGKITDSTFIGNYANYNGGAVYWNNDYGTMDNCRFNDNYVTRNSYYGGAVYWTGSYGNLKNTNFTDNKAYYGGAVYWSGNSGTLEYCEFDNNGPYSIYNYGSAIYWTGSNGNLKKSKFTDNKAYYIGAVYWKGTSGTIDYCEFNNNTASNSDGGAVYWESGSGNLKNSNFTNNQASNGGAVYWSSSNGKIVKCDFLNNTANNRGGAVYKYTYASEIQNCNFTNNTANYGGALSFRSTGSDKITGCNFNNNTADFGDEIEWYNSVCEITGTTFNGKTKGYDEYFYVSSKFTPEINILADNIDLGETLYLVIEFAEGMLGNMTVTLTDINNDKIVYSSLQKLPSNIYLTIPNLKRGTYRISANYTGDNIYFNTITTKNVEVYRWNSSVDFSVNDIRWGSPVVLNPKVTSGATGLIDIYVNGNYRDTFKVGSTYNLMGVGGPYSDIELVYLGDDSYNPSSSSKRVNVERLDTNFNAPESIESGNPSSVEININEDASGNIEVTLGSTLYSGTVQNGKFRFNAYSLTSGSKYMKIDYKGDSKYNPFTTSFNVQVTLRTPTIKLDVSNVLAGKSVIIKPVVTAGATGTFKIYVDGNYIDQISYNEQYSLSGQSVGKHDVKVTYSGNSYYAGSQNQTAFRVYRFYPIEVENTAIIYGSGKHFQATFYDEYGDVLANKLVSFRINDKDNVVMTDKDGVAVLNMDFNIGNYSITSINTIVNEKLISKLEVYSSIQSQNMERAYNTGTDFKVKLFDENAKPLIKGFAIFNVNGNNYAVMTDNEGFATLNAGILPGTYTVITTNVLTGESKTNSLKIFSSISADNMIRGYNSGMDFRARFVDNNNLPLVNKLVTFKIGSVEYESTTDSNGYAVLNQKLNVGKYEILITNKITGEKSFKNLTIAERITENNNVIWVQGEDSYYTVHVIGDDGKPVGANEVVSITINEGIYEIRTDSNGYASFKIDQNIGSYKITAKYKEFSVTNDVYVLEKVNYIENLNVKDISYKQEEDILLSLTTFTGDSYIEFIITGDNGYKHTFNREADSTISLTVSDLNATRYSVTANYYDLKNFKFSRQIKTFNVNKINPEIIITTNDANVGENASVIVNIPDVEGTVVIKVGNQVIYNDNIVKNGVIIKNIDSLAEGRYQVSVTYNGDNNYNMASKTDVLTIIQNKILTAITANDITVTYGKESYIVATLKDMYGTSLANKNVSIYFNSLNSILTTDDNGQVKLKISNAKANTYNAVITFVADDTYAGSTKTVKISIINPAVKTKITLSLKKVKVKKSAKKLTIKAALKINGKAAEKVKVKFKFNGKKYTAKTNKKGVAKITIKQKILKKLKVGKKVKYQATYGKITVKKSVKVKK